MTNSFKAIIVADCHIGADRFGASPERWDAPIREAFQYAVDNQADVVISCGDFFNKRNPTVAELLRRRELLETLEEAAIPFKEVDGNHDRSNAEGSHSALEIERCGTLFQGAINSVPFMGKARFIALPWPRTVDYLTDDEMKLGIDEKISATRAIIISALSTYMDRDPDTPVIFFGHCMVAYGGNYGSNTSSMDASGATLSGPDTGRGERVPVVEGSEERTGDEGLRDVHSGRSTDVRSSVRLRTNEGSDPERSDDRPLVPDAAVRELGSSGSGDSAGQHAEGRHGIQASSDGDALPTGAPLRYVQHEVSSERGSSVSSVRSGLPAQESHPKDPGLILGKDVVLPFQAFLDAGLTANQIFMGHVHDPSALGYVGSTQPTDWSDAEHDKSFVELVITDSDLSPELIALGYDYTRNGNWTYATRRHSYTDQIRLHDIVIDDIYEDSPFLQILQDTLVGSPVDVVRVTVNLEGGGIVSESQVRAEIESTYNYIRLDRVIINHAKREAVRVETEVAMADMDPDEAFDLWLEQAGYSAEESKAPHAEFQSLIEASK